MEMELRVDEVQPARRRWKKPIAVAQSNVARRSFLGYIIMASQKDIWLCKALSEVVLIYYNYDQLGCMRSNRSLVTVANLP